AYRLPNVVRLPRHMAPRGRAATLELAEQAVHFGFCRSQRAGPRFHVADIVEQRRQLSQSLAGGGVVIGVVFAVGGVEQVAVVTSWVVARANELKGKLERAGSHRAAAAADLEELILGEFPCLGRVGDEPRLHPAILAADTLQREKEEGLRQLALCRPHAAGNVERADHYCIGRGPRPRAELMEAQVVIGKRHRVRLDRATLYRFLERPAAIEAGSNATLAPAFA